MLAAALCPPLASCSRSSCPTVTSRAVSDLDDFGTWLSTYGVQGVIGEVGWPGGKDAAKWNSVADSWFDRADELGLGVVAWAAAERWAPSYPLAIFRESDNNQLVVGPQADVLAQHRPADSGRPQPGDQLRGVALADASFGASWEPSGSYSAQHPGVAGVDYSYPGPDFLRQLHAKGVRTVRIAVEWERLQPRLDAPLNGAEVDRLRATISDAAALGIASVIDLHNYGRYARVDSSGRRVVLRVGDPALPSASLADLWRRLTQSVRGERGLVGLGLMNEPHDLPGGSSAWEATTKQVVAAVRSVDPDVPVFVPGYNWSNVHDWGRTHARPWVQDAHVFYEAHAYFDLDRTGTYQQSYVQEEQAVAAACSS